jgi:hypothetical protein
MKKLLIALTIASAMAVAVHAGEGKKPQLTPEQKALKQQMLTKYDTNKDGKLDKEEKAKITPEDKAKMEQAGLTHKKGEKKDGEKKDEKTETK